MRPGPSPTSSGRGSNERGSGPGGDLVIGMHRRDRSARRWPLADAWEAGLFALTLTVVPAFVVALTVDAAWPLTVVTAVTILIATAASAVPPEHPYRCGGLIHAQVHQGADLHLRRQGAGEQPLALLLRLLLRLLVLPVGARSGRGQITVPAGRGPSPRGDSVGTRWCCVVLDGAGAV